jgi:hypothetical protein
MSAEYILLLAPEQMVNPSSPSISFVIVARSRTRMLFLRSMAGITSSAKYSAFSSPCS